MRALTCRSPPSVLPALLQQQKKTACPDDAPYGVCAEGNPCERNPCGAGQWCQLGCGCGFRCFAEDVVTIASGGAKVDAAADGAAAAGSIAVGNSSDGGGGGGAKWGPVVLPSKPQLPNVTEVVEAAKVALAAAARAAVAHAAPAVCKAAAPGACAAGGGCEARRCAADEFCVPACNSCGDAKCVRVALPAKLPKLPALPAFDLPAKLRNLSMPRPPCKNNEAINLIATVRTLPATMLMSASHRLSVYCSACRNGTVAKQPAFACTLCLPGTYADARLSVCRRCQAGYYASKAGATACEPCPRDTFAPISGAFACVPCPPGFSTQGKRAQSMCAFDPTHSYLV